MTSSDNGYENVDSVIDDIRQEFLFGTVDDSDNKQFLTVTQLAEKYNVSYNTLRQKYSAPEKWREEREDIRKKIQEKVNDKKTDHEAEKIVQIDSAYENAFSKLRELTVKSIDSKVAIKVQSYELINFANTLITCYEGEKVAHGESLDQDNNSGWDALEKAFEEPPDSENEKC
ncbi:hypothetical protein SDC9_30511 [bioreactor metagenome]|uniref:Uncharacterized protein n=1 Tax=bioreactor metagenome TaxID=1076179 RepID=A0A644UZP5_9ZZZZ|nr:hypothetical protein [Methanobrevibacter sp.]MEA4957556.1 hypothetical protein [Methanobrevibacter sp.]